LICLRVRAYEIETEGGEAMIGSGGGGFVIDTATLFLFFVGLSVLAGIWFWLRKKGQKKH
jgi:LPXTG-motif cell wall-anchored protein